MKNTAASIKNNGFILSVLLAAFVLRLIPIPLFGISGDEWYTIYTAEHPEVSCMALPYFYMVRLILHFAGIAVPLLRLLSVLIAVAGVGAIYLLGKKFFSRAVGRALALFSAVSPYLIMDSLEIRYYSLFFLVSVISFISFLWFLRRQTLLRFFVFGAVAAAAFFSHINCMFLTMGFVLYLLAEKLKRKMIWVFAGIVALLLATAPFRLEIFAWMATVLYRAVPSYGIGMIGWHSSTFVKPVFAVFSFVWGYNMNPLRWEWVLPGLLLFAALLFKGIRYARRQYGYPVSFWVYTGLVPLLFLMFVIEPISTIRFQGVLQPKHLVFSYIPFLMAVTLGVVSMKRRAFKLAAAAAVLLMSGIAYMQIFKPEFSTYSPRYVDFSRAAEYLRHMTGENSSVILEPRAKQSFEFYNQKELAGKEVMEMHDFLDREGFSPEYLAFASDNWKAQNPGAKTGREIEDFSRFYEKMNREYTLNEGFVQYPFLFYVFQTKASAKKNQPDTPVEPYGFEYSNLKLPAAAGKYQILSSFALNKNRPEWSTNVEGMAEGKKKLVLFLNLEHSSTLPNGTAAAILELQTGNETRQINLIKGEHLYDTFNDYHKSAPVPAEAVAVSWKKQPLVSRSVYFEGARAYFTASIYRLEIPLDAADDPDFLRIRYQQETGALRIWGVYFE